MADVVTRIECEDRHEKLVPKWVLCAVFAAIFSFLTFLLGYIYATERGVSAQEIKIEALSVKLDSQKEVILELKTMLKEHLSERK